MNCIIFMNNLVQRGQNETVTQHLETRNYSLRAVSDVKKIIGNH